MRHLHVGALFDHPQTQRVTLLNVKLVPRIADLTDDVMQPGELFDPVVFEVVQRTAFHPKPAQRISLGHASAKVTRKAMARDTEHPRDRLLIVGGVALSAIPIGLRKRLGHQIHGNLR